MSELVTSDMTHDPELYARSFADVYDDWYGDLDDPGHIVSAFVGRFPPPADLIELGSGTGRLAAPLAEAGYTVVALDASPSMLAAGAPGPRAVVSDMAQIGLCAGAADAVLLAYNTLFNLASRRLQLNCLAEAQRVLRPGGKLAVEAFIAPTGAGGSGAEDSFGVTLRPHPTDPAGSLAIVTGDDPGDPEVIVGCHVELRNHATTCRPWRLVYQSPERLDAAARKVGLTLAERHGGWRDEPFDPGGVRHVSWYQAG